MEAAKRLREVPGIGAVTATAIASRLAGKTFAHPDQFVAYIGLDIDVRASGNRRGTRGLTTRETRSCAGCSTAALRRACGPRRALSKLSTRASGKGPLFDRGSVFGGPQDGQALLVAA